MKTRYEGELVVSSLIRDRADRLGGEIAVVNPAGDLTYGELGERAACVAGALAALQVAPGDRVATMLEPSLEYLAAWFGVAWAGAVEVPVNTEFKGEFLVHVLRQSGASVLVVDGRWLERLEPLELPELRHVVVVGEPTAEPPAGVALQRFGEALSHDPVERIARAESDLAYILYTSGTTGPSKGVMQSNRSAIVSNVLPWIDLLGLGHEDVAYSMFPLFHGTGRNAVVTSTFWAGGRVALRSRFSVRGFWDDIRACGATFFAYMGAVIHLLHAQDPHPDDADNPVRVAFGGAAPPELMDDFERRFGLDLVEVYGSTELGVTTASPRGRRKPGRVGRPLDHVILEIHDEDDETLPPGVAGEIVARPAKPYGIFSGYWGDPDGTLAAFRNLWFHSGDRALLDEDGYLVFIDRIKDAIRRRGENISSFEVERALNAHPAVLECAAYPVPSELTEDEVMIAVVPRETEIDPAELFAFCAESMPRFAVPRYLRIMEELPKNPSQRVQKYLLREQGVTADAVDREALGIAVPRS